MRLVTSRYLAMNSCFLTVRDRGKQLVTVVSTHEIGQETT